LCCLVNGCKETAKFRLVQVQKYVFDFNLAIDQGMNLRDARREADKLNYKMDERTKVELDVFIRNISLDSKKGKKIDYNKALGAVQETQTMTTADIKKKMDEQIAEMRKTLDKLNLIASKIPVDKVKPSIPVDKMKPSKDKKVEIEMLAITLPFGNNNSYKVYMVDNDGSIQKQFKEARNDQERKYVLEANKYSIYKSETIFDERTKNEIRKDINRQETIANIEQKGGLFNLKISEIKREKVTV